MAVKDSVIASTILHPQDAATKAAAWLYSQMLKAGEVAQPGYDEPSGWSVAPSQEQQAEAGLNLAGLLDTGAAATTPTTAGGALGMAIRTKPDPEKTIRAYKLLALKEKYPGEFFPLFMDAKEPMGKIGQWLDAEVGKGPMAPRPAWHAGGYPAAYHIGEGGGKGQPAKYRRDNEVWGEVDMANDMDWYAWALQNGGKGRDGVLYGRVPERLITDVPTDGAYLYKTNRQQKDPWILSGAMRINRLLHDQEVQAINKAMGVAPDPPRKPGFDFDEFVRRFGLRNEDF